MAESSPGMRLVLQVTEADLGMRLVCPGTARIYRVGVGSSQHGSLEGSGVML